MTPDPDSFPDDRLPPALLADLRAIQRTPAVPASVDAGIRAQSRGYFARQRRARTWVRLGGGLAAAILVVVGIRIVTDVVRHEANPTLSDKAPAAPQAEQLRIPTTAPAIVRADFLKRDIDRSGRVDILDAFAVARGIKAGATPIAWDIQGDGVVDQSDVDEIAAAVVRVKGGVQ